MPITKNVFIKGKMNKDLDERIVPNGEYRDALNVQISTSDGSDIGVMQNVLGNKLAYDSAINITSGKCIGSAADTENNKIYWFIAGTNVDAIAEYDESTRVVSPVLVSVKTPTVNVLKFDKSKLITGINIIDGLLFFTDDNSEPKQINIEDCKSGSTNFSTHTKFTKYDGTEYNFEEKDITVIKCGPLSYPSISISDTLRLTPSGDPAVVSSNFNATFSDTGGVLKKPGDILFLSFPNNPDFKAGDKLEIRLAAPEDTDQRSARVRGVIVSIVTYGLFRGFRFQISSISEAMPAGRQLVIADLIEQNGLFEKDFIRFAYRYKYKDGEYSPIGPFSSVAFLPGDFDYDSVKGHNKGMLNQTKSIKISNFIDSYIPNNVSEIELLFKKDSSTNIYNLKSFEYKDVEWQTNTYKVESELIHKVLPANQLLRPHDNVPLKAKAQEIVANRLIYGNYLQNFNLLDSSNEQVNVKFLTSLNTEKFKPASGGAGKSIKSMRSYQLGVTYIDQYGRETPIQTDESAVINIGKQDAVSYSGITAQVSTNPPSFAKYYKFYIKETSNQYYNLAMDRWYDAEDGNAWLSFPSSERNKVDEETFLILKKAHDTSDLIKDEAKYKILDIKNEAPQEIKEYKTSLGAMSQNGIENSHHTNFFSAEFWPKEDATFFKIRKDFFEDAFGKANTSNPILTESNLFLKIFADNVGTSRYYKIKSVQSTDDGWNGTSSIDNVIITLADKIESDTRPFFPQNSNFITGTQNHSNSGVNGLGLEIFQSEIINKKEFVGRFFAKVHRDSILETEVLKTATEGDYSIVSSMKFRYRSSKQGFSKSAYKNNLGWESHKTRWYVDLNFTNFHRFMGTPGGNDLSLMGPNRSHDYNPPHSSGSPSTPWGDYFKPFATNPITKGRDKIVLKYLTKWKISDIKSDGGGKYANFVEAILTKGTKIRFSGDDSRTVYEIIGSAFWGFHIDSKDKDWRANKHCLFILQLDKPIQNYSLSDIPDDSEFYIELLKDYESEERFTSTNPAIFETEPKEAVDIDIYYEASNALEIEEYHSEPHELEWYNCFSFGNGVESNRIRDDFNAPTIAKGVKVSAPLAEQYKEERRKSGLIFSGIFNSTSGINRLNQFIAAENITKDLNPEYGSIQKFHTRDTDLITFCEDKVLKVLAQKDALFNADGNANVTSNAAVLGQAIPFVGEFGISKNPESFASYGYRMYFADKSRGMVMRLSRNGLESISAKGMQSYFYDKLNLSNRIIGTFDVRKGNYNLTLIEESAAGEVLESLDTVSYKEEAQGWPSRKSYIPEAGLSLNSIYYTFKNGELYSHNNETRNTFYGGSAEKSSVKLILNSNPSEIKNYKTVNYEGNPGWVCSSIITDQQNGDVQTFIEEEGKYYNFIKGVENTWDSITQSGGLDTKEFSTQGIDTLQSITDGVGQTEVTITIKENND